MERHDAPSPASDRASPSRVDPTVIPRVQDGRGDTPGPGNIADMGRPWAAAQLLVGEGIIAVDVRSPAEWAAGHLPGAVSLPEAVAEAALDALPPPTGDLNVVVYDAAGDQGSAAVAELLRDRGWPMARRLVGGFAEWLRAGEEVVRPAPVEGARFQVGDAVGAGATVWRISVGADGEPRYDICVQGTGEVRRGLSLEEIEP